MRGADVARWVTAQQWASHTHTHTLSNTITEYGQRACADCCQPIICRLSSTQMHMYFLPIPLPRIHTHKPICSSWMNTWPPCCSTVTTLLFYPVNRRVEGFHSSSSRQSEDNTSYFGFTLISNRQLNIPIRSYQHYTHTNSHTHCRQTETSKAIAKLSVFLHSPPTVNYHEICLGLCWFTVNVHGCALCPQTVRSG